MKKTLLLLFLSLGSLCTMAQTLKVVVKQNGKIVKPVSDVYMLKKQAFQFEIKADHIEGFLVGVTTDENHFGEAVDFFEPDEPWFQNTGMAEGLFNANKELYLMETAPSYWYYTAKNDHRFDRDPIGTAEQWTSTRSITKLYDITAEQEVALKDIETSIYIYMFDPEYDDDYSMSGKKTLFFGELRFTD